MEACYCHSLLLQLGLLLEATTKPFRNKRNNKFPKTSFGLATVRYIIACKLLETNPLTTLTCVQQQIGMSDSQKSNAEYACRNPPSFFPQEVMKPRDHKASCPLCHFDCDPNSEKDSKELNHGKDVMERKMEGSATITLSLRAFCCSCSAFFSSESAHTFIKIEGSVYLFTHAPAPAPSNLDPASHLLNLE
jgi:hypothetical protein